jgi:TPR repeat protein
MKPLVLASLFMASFCLHAQVGTDPRALTKRIAPLLPPPQPSVRPAHVVPAGSAPSAAGTAAATSAADSEEKQMQMSLEAKKKLQWETERAEKGSDSMQYTLGMHYLKGEGAPQDLKKARKWLEASAKQNNPDAKKALAEHPELPPYDPKEDVKTPGAKTSAATSSTAATPSAATTEAKQP